MAALNDVLLQLGGNSESELTAQTFRAFRTEVQRAGFEEAKVTNFPPTTTVTQEQELLAEFGYQQGMPYVRGRGEEAYELYMDGATVTHTFGCPEIEGMPMCPPPTDEFYIYIIG